VLQSPGYLLLLPGRGWHQGGFSRGDGEEELRELFLEAGSGCCYCIRGIYVHIYMYTSTERQVLYRCGNGVACWSGGDVTCQRKSAVREGSEVSEVSEW